MLSQIIGGLGLFLLGMMLLSENLQSAASRTLRRVLGRMVYNPWTAIASGATVTAILQSSSATTLITIGFVNAGLISFSQSLGLIYGANLGTTSTAWFVALVGLKISMTSLVLPLIGLGTLLKVFGRGTWAFIGMAIAGFGLIFLGIDTLQQGMSELSKHIDLESVPATGLQGKLVLLVAGSLLTVLLQSSSAAMTATLAALFTGAITLEHGAVLVIGQNIGTTITAAIASIGASISAKRTALAHLLFNVLTGLVALLLLPLFIYLSSMISEKWFGGGAAVALATFHFLFNAIGIAIMLPLTEPFSRLLHRIVPEKSILDTSRFTERLDRSSTTDTSIDLESLRLSLQDISLETIDLCKRFVSEPKDGSKFTQNISDMRQALNRCYDYIYKISTDPNIATKNEPYPLHIELLHAMSHLDQLITVAAERITTLPDLMPAGRRSADAASTSEEQGKQVRTEEFLESLGSHLQLALQTLRTNGKATDLAQSYDDLASLQKKFRSALIQEIAMGRFTKDEVTKGFEILRLGDAIGLHSWRLTLYLLSGNKEL